MSIDKKLNISYHRSQQTPLVFDTQVFSYSRIRYIFSLEPSRLVMTDYAQFSRIHMIISAS